ncbi:unnamed protein product [Schistosoma mattheei]|uniref:Uncharacterized protein n=1 Tax=Schistosoma mattheei TaxID=31246 RepID=A0A183NT83_9TREM|nr:unnamed protein product [Schistosoma mattheei]
MNSLSKCTTLSESTDSQLCFNSNLTTTTTTPTTTTTTTKTNDNTTFNENSSIDTNLINFNKDLSIMNEQNEPINLCIRDQFKLDLMQYTNKMKIISNIFCANNIHDPDRNNIDYFGMNHFNGNNINDNYNNSFYLTDLTNKMNMNLYATTNKMMSTELKWLPDSLNQFLMMNHNNIHHNFNYNSANITSTSTTTVIDNNNSNNIQGSSMYSIIRTPSPTVQQSHLDNEFLTSTPVWRNKLTDDIETVKIERENLREQQNERETSINETEKMKWRKYSRQINRLYYSRNKIVHTQRKIHRKLKNHPDSNNIQKNPINGEDANDTKDNGVITCRTNTRSICRRRRVGWRGTTICAACGLMFEGMNQLNTHYSHVHGSLLESECTFAQYSNSKTSKLLFQAQLDLLISEKELQNNSLTSTTNEKNFIPTTSISLTTCKENHFDISSINSTVNHSIDKPFDQFNQQIKSYPCPKCNYIAKWPTELQKHVMVHANSRPFICCVCTTSYKWSWDLGRHFTNSHPNLPNPYKRQRINKTIFK